MSHHRHDHQPQLLRPQKHTHDAIQIVVRIRRQYDPSGGAWTCVGFSTRERNRFRTRTLGTLLGTKYFSSTTK